MKFLKMKVSSDILARLGHPLIFKALTSVEVLNILQYDPQHLFLLVKLVFRPAITEEQWEQMIRDNPVIEEYYKLRQAGNETLCLMAMRKPAGDSFWPGLPAGQWAILPPVILDPDYIHITFVISEEHFPLLQATLGKLAAFREILAMRDIEKSIPTADVLSPRFTTRQREVAQYAVRRGYLDTPKRVTAQEIAAHFHVSVPTVNKHLRKVERIALEYFFS